MPPEGTSGGILKSHRPSVCPSVRQSVRPSVSPSVTNRVSAITHKLLKQRTGLHKVFFVVPEYFSHILGTNSHL